MAGEQISSLNWRVAKFSDGTFTDQNELSNALLKRPEIANTLAFAFGDKFFLGYITAGRGAIATDYKLLGNEEFQWALHTNITKPLPISGLVTPSSKPGLGFTIFQIPFPEKYFAVGDVLRFPSGLTARVMNEPLRDGSGKWIHDMQINTPDPAAYMVSTDIAEGTMIAKIFTSFEEFSEGGASKVSTPNWFRNQMTISRASFGMSGSSATDVMVLEIQTPKGKSALWMPFQQWQHTMQFNRDKEMLLWHGKFNKTTTGEIPLLGKNTRPVKIGAGLYDQIAFANTRTYETLTEDYLLDFMLDLQTQSKEAENTKLVLRTGAGGIKQFGLAMREALKAAQIIDTVFITKTGRKMEFSTMAGVTTYRGLLGTELTVMHDPMLDDKTLYPELDPVDGLTKESYRMTFLQMGDYNGEPNISMVAKGANGVNRSMLTWVTAGSQTPDGGTASEGLRAVRSNALDGWFVHMLSECAIKVTNPLSCGMLIRNIS